MGLFSKIVTKFSKKPVDWDELEEILISSDIGVPLTLRIMDKLQDMGKSVSAETVNEVCREEIKELLPPDAELIRPFPDRPKMIFVVGVNGTGKTTSTAKLAAHFKGRGATVMLAAADTFRAAAIEQLDIWAERVGVPIVKGKYQSDPASVCFEAMQQARSRKLDFLICDTAGRLHTRHNLMEELAKLKRTVAKVDPTAPHEIFIVVDATTGSNALNQAKEFQKALGDLSGLIVTKLDGSGKGGIIVGIQDQLGIPARFIGTGETAEDFAAFEADSYVKQIL